MITFFALFSENGTLTVSVKTPESDHESSSCVDQDLDEFSVVFELTPCDVGSPNVCGTSSDKRGWTENRKLQMFLTLAQTSAAGLKTRNFN